MKGLDLSKFKKVAEDNKTVTMKHDKGHTMIIALHGLPKIQREQIKRIKMADGGNITDPTKAKSAQDSMRDAFHFDEGGDVPKQAPVTVNVGAPPTMPTIPQGQASAPVVPQIPQAPNALLPNGSMSAPGAAQSAQMGAKLGTDIQAAQAAAEVPNLQQNLESQSAQNKFSADNVNFVNGAFNNLKEYINDPKNKFNENAYIENMGAGRKITTALGMILGGAGAGVAGGSNPAMDFLKDQIDRNIQGQKERYGRQQTVWSAAKDLFGSNQSADAFARAHQLDYLKTKAELIAKQLGTPTAAAAYLDLSSKLSPAMNKSILDSAGNLSSTPNNPARGSSGPSSSSTDQGMHKTSPNQKLIDAGLMSGEPSAKASIPKEKQESPEAENNSILAPNAEAKLNNLQYGGSKAREDYPKALEQYTKSRQVEKQIAQINDLFPKLRQEATLSGNIGSHINPHAFGATGAGIGAVVGGGGLGALSGGTLAIPGAAGGATAGGVLGEGVAHGLRGMSEAIGGQKEVQYQTDKAGLAKFLIGALGGQATGQEIDDIVNTNTPGYWDNDKTYKKKLDNIKKFLINRTETSLIDRYHLTTK